MGSRCHVLQKAPDDLGVSKRIAGAFPVLDMNPLVRLANLCGNRRHIVLIHIGQPAAQAGEKMMNDPRNNALKRPAIRQRRNIERSTVDLLDYGAQTLAGVKPFVVAVMLPESRMKTALQTSIAFDVAAISSWTGDHFA